jgi:anti-sigma factor RsiW
VKRTCELVQARLPHVADGTLTGWRRRLLLRHIADCDACASEFERQQTVSEGLHELGEAAHGSEPDPPEELLDEILDRVHNPGLRERVAGPARGAVSGARPELSVTAVLLAMLVVYATWRAARRLVGWLRRLY